MGGLRRRPLWVRHGPSMALSGGSAVHEIAVTVAVVPKMPVLCHELTSCTSASYSKTSPVRTSSVGATAELQFGIFASPSCSSIARSSLVLPISAREWARSRLVSASTAFRRSISRRVSETREDIGLSSTGSAHCTAGASTRLPNAQGLIQGSTTDGTSGHNRSSMGTTGHLSVSVSPGAVALPNLLHAGCSPSRVARRRM